MLNIKSKTESLSRINEAFFVAIFTALAVYTPSIVHFFGGVNGGREFLPMPFFVLLAGLMLGWRAGLATALMSPIVSYLISGMPMANILPFITLQLCAYGIVAGILAKKYNAFISVTGAVIAGWLMIGISIFLFSSMNALSYVTQGIKAGTPGIVIQLILLPVIILFAKRFFTNEKRI